MNLLNSWVAYKMTDLLTKSFSDWEACQMGIIDGDGKILMKPKTPAEKDAFGMFHKMVRKLKLIIQRLAGKTKAAAVLATLYLMKEAFLDRDSGGSSDPAVNYMINEIAKRDDDFREHVFSLMENKTSKLDVLEPGRYFLVGEEGEVRVVVESSIYKRGSIFGNPVFCADGEFFTRDMIRRVIPVKGEEHE